MKYIPVSFELPFQEWSKRSGVVCTCGHFRPHEIEGHQPECPVSVALPHWREAGHKLYATMPKVPVVIASDT